jgi:hypothetical protein
MATGPEHYTRAEQLLRETRDGHQEGTDVAAILAAAQVHATLANAAATRDAGIPRGYILVERCDIAESAHGRQCGRHMDHLGACDFTAGGGA